MRQRMVSVTDPTSNPFSVIITLAWPIFLEQVLVSLVQSIDTAMVGSLGANATASVAISQNPINLINSVILALGVGFTTMIARAVGAGQYDYSKLLIRQSIVVVIALGIPLSALCFALSRQIPIWMGAAPRNSGRCTDLYSNHRLFHAVPRIADGTDRNLPRFWRQPNANAD